MCNCELCNASALFCNFCNPPASCPGAPASALHAQILPQNGCSRPRRWKVYVMWLYASLGILILTSFLRENHVNALLFGSHHSSTCSYCVSLKVAQSPLKLGKHRAKQAQRNNWSPRPSQSPPSALFLGDFFNFGQKEATDGKGESAATTPPKGDTANADDDDGFQDGAYDEDDPVEKIFGFFFGKREASPMGMNRFGPDRFPEQYPATKTEWADPVSTDDGGMAVVRPFLKNTNLETRALKLSYDANRDGWDPNSFHNAVDKRGGGIVVCTSRLGIVCGGYNPKGWVSYGEARGSIAAFLFIVGSQYAASGAPGIKLQKVGGPGLAQMDMPESGPSFGADALVIPLAKQNPKQARSKLGSYYERLPDGVNTLFGKDASVQLSDFKVYQGVYADGEFIPFTDAEPFALY